MDHARRRRAAARAEIAAVDQQHPTPCSASSRNTPMPLMPPPTTMTSNAPLRRIVSRMRFSGQAWLCAVGRLPSGGRSSTGSVHWWRSGVEIGQMAAGCLTDLVELVAGRVGCGRRCAFSRACSGLRAPQSAKVMPGCCSVQAMTICALAGAVRLGDRPRSPPSSAATLLAVGLREARIVLALVVAGEDAVRARSCRTAGRAPARNSSASRRRARRRTAAASRSMSRCTMLYCSWIASSCAGGEIGLEIGDADSCWRRSRGSCPAVFRSLERLHRLRDRRRRVLPVGDVVVDVVGAAGACRLCSTS